MFTNLALPYGLSLALLAWIALTLGRRSTATLPWPCLAVFALSAGLGSWATAWLGTSGLVGRVSVAALTAGVGVALLEFARRAHNVLIDVQQSNAVVIPALGPPNRPPVGRPRGITYLGRYRHRRCPAWIDLPLVGLAALGIASGQWSGISVGCRYALVLPGGLWSSVLLWRAARTAASGVRELRLAAVAMGLFALSFGLIVPGVSWAPASWLNQAVFFSTVGFSIQAVEALAALVVAVSLWLYGVRTADPAPAGAWHARWPLGAAILLALAVAWAAVHDTGSDAGAALAGAGQAMALVPEQEAAEAERADWSRLTSERWRSGIPIILGVVVVLAALVVAGILTNDRPRSRSGLSGCRRHGC